MSLLPSQGVIRQPCAGLAGDPTYSLAAGSPTCPKGEVKKRCVCACWLLLKEIYFSLGSLVLERLEVLPPTFAVPQHEAFNFHLKSDGKWLLLIFFHCGSERSAKIHLISSLGRMEDFLSRNSERNIFFTFFHILITNFTLGLASLLY